MRVDRKLVEVPVGEYRYRHEAEFAAGFLADQGIPYRLQFDDAGGADLGLSMLRPAVLWVRAVDAEIARELLELDPDEPEPPVVRPPSPTPGSPSTRGSPLAPMERAVSAGLAVAFFSGIPYVPFGPMRPFLGGLCLAGALVFLVVAAAARAPGPLERVIKALAGSPPR
jgi:hypothetical protein